MKIIIFLFLFLSHSSLASAEIIDGIVATVGDRIISYREVLTESKLAIILSSKNDYVSLPIKGVFSVDMLGRMVNIELIFKEAKRLGFEMKETDILDQMLALEEAFYYDGEFNLFLKQEGLSMDDLLENLTTKKIVEAFVADKVTLMSHVSAVEVKAFFEENEERYEGRKFKDVEQEARKALEEKKGLEFLDKWLKDIRARGNVKYLKFPPLQSSTR